MATPKVQNGIVQDFYFPPGQSGGDSAVNLLLRVANVSGGSIDGLIPGNPQIAGPIYVIRLTGGKLVQCRGESGLVMVRGDRVRVHTDPKTGALHVEPVKPRQMRVPA
jgi:hypothetical protein